MSDAQNIAVDVMVESCSGERSMLWWMSCHGEWRKNNLLEFLERSVRGEALAQSNCALGADFVVVQTAKPQKKIRKKNMSDFPKHRGRC